MLSDLNDYLPNDLSLIVIEYVKFSDKQLSILMNQEMDSDWIYMVEVRCLTKDEQAKIIQFAGYLCSCDRFQQDARLSIVYSVGGGTGCDGRGFRSGILMVNTSNFSKQVDITKARVRISLKKKHSIHFHGSTIVIADDDKTFRVYDFDSDFT
jgi:hypothetical protein